MAGNSFGARAGLDVGDRSLEVFRLDALDSVGDVGGLPFSLKVLLENLLRNEDGSAVTAEDIEAFARWDPAGAEDREIAFSPARVLMQDFTGVRPSSTWPPCATPWAPWAATRRRSTRWPRPSW
jgi:aconitate hydratase